MDVPELLRGLRDRRGWSQSDLATAVGLTRGSIGDYEAGRRSPTVATLNRLLAAVGLQIRADLEPLLAELDERVDAVSAEPQPLSEDRLAELARAVEGLGGEHPYTVDRGPDEEPDRRVGELRWAFDGETALRLQGLGFAAATVELAVVWEDVTRSFFFRRRVQGTGRRPVPWLTATRDEAQACLGELALGPFGMVRVRLVDELPQAVRVEVAPGVVVPVLALSAVEEGRRDLSDVLVRLRERWATRGAA